MEKELKKFLQQLTQSARRVGELSSSFELHSVPSPDKGDRNLGRGNQLTQVNQNARRNKSE